MKPANGFLESLPGRPSISLPCINAS